MAGKFSVSVDGMGSISKGLDDFIGDIDAQIVKSLKSSLVTIENTMKNGVRSSLLMVYSKDILLQSISHTAQIGKDGNPVGDVGVYDMSNKTQSQAKRPRKSRTWPTAPTVAYWLETGVQPHSLYPGSKSAEKPSRSKPRGAPPKNQDRGKMHPGIKPTPIFDNAFFLGAPKLNQTLINDLNKLVK